MLDFGWAELFMIALVAVFAIGPNEIPAMMRSFGRVVRRIQYLKYSVMQQFDDFMNDDPLSAVNFEVSRNNNEHAIEHDFDEAAEDEELAEIEAAKAEEDLPLINERKGDE
tara:strand:+ start:141 stop:473 length:333 start_codon:yes stop_codon:yes gene_type:complete